MIIKEKGQEFSVEVYVIYWADSKIHYIGVPYEGYEGLNALIDDEVDIIDNSIDNFIIRNDDYNGKTLIHKAADEGDLIYELIDHQTTAVEEFRRRLAEYK